MEFLDRYLNAVRRHLPWQGQDDIIAELEANLQAQLEDKEAELGRRLTDAEMEAWLTELGSPVMVAARYKPQQYLIGPGLFPFYWNVLRLSLSWCAAIYVVVKVVDIVANSRGGVAIGGAVLGLPWILLINAAIVTLVFAVIERAGVRVPEKLASMGGSDPWMKAMEMPFEGPLGDGNKQRSYAKAVGEVIFGYPFLAWLLLVPHYPYLLFGPGAAYLLSLPYKLAPVWWTFYGCLVVLNAFELAWKTVALVRGRWRGPHLARHLAMRVISLVPLMVLAFAPGQSLFLPKDAGQNGAELPMKVAETNHAIHHALLVAIAVVVLRILWSTARSAIEARHKKLAAQ